MPISLLFNWRVWLAVAIGVALGMTHWKIYKLGEQNVQMQWDAEKLEVTQQTIKLQQEAEAKAKALQDEKDKLRKAKNAEIVETIALGNELVPGIRTTG